MNNNKTSAKRFVMIRNPETSEVFWTHATLLSRFNGLEVLCDKETEQEIRDEVERYYHDLLLYGQYLN